MKLVIFTLCDREYAIDVVQVREVIRTTSIEPLPDVPSYIEGIINLRGDVIPIVSLRRKLGMETSTHTQTSMNRVIIAHRQERCFGILVDNVLGVNTFPRKDLSVPDDLLRQSGIVHAVAKMQDRLIPLLDLYRLINPSDALPLPQEATGLRTTTGEAQPNDGLTESLKQG